MGEASVSPTFYIILEIFPVSFGNLQISVQEQAGKDEVSVNRRIKSSDEV